MSRNIWKGSEVFDGDGVLGFWRPQIRKFSLFAASSLSSFLRPGTYAQPL
jgi:hypothetical protein